MYIFRERGQLPGPPGYRRRPSARFLAPCSHTGDPASQNCHGSPLLSGSRRLLPAICKELRSDCRSFARSNQERCGLPLERRMPYCLRSAENIAHDQPHHCLPGFQPGLSAVHRRLHCRPRHYPGSSPRWQGAHHLLRFQGSQPG